MISLDQNDVLRMNNHAARSMLERASKLIENGSEFLQRQNSKRILRDGNDAFGTLIRREARCVFQRSIAQRREMESALITKRWIKF